MVAPSFQCRVIVRVPHPEPERQQDQRRDSWHRADTQPISANKITSGTLGTGRIPNLAASKITSGALADARIPSLNASKVTAGTFPLARIPIVVHTTQASYDAASGSDNQIHMLAVIMATHNCQSDWVLPDSGPCISISYHND